MRRPGRQQNYFALMRQTFYRCHQQLGVIHRATRGRLDKIICMSCNTKAACDRPIGGNGAPFVFLSSSPS
jgi:hypothetical protein